VLSERNLARDSGDFIPAGKGRRTNSKIMFKIRNTFSAARLIKHRTNCYGNGGESAQWHH